MAVQQNIYGKLIDRCIKCKEEIKGEYFDGVNGKICINCIKDLYIYHNLKSLGMIKSV